MAKKGVNKITLLGNLGSNPELSYFPNSNKAKCVVNLATSEVYKDRNGQKQEDTEWHRCVIYGKRAEIVAQFREKGDQLYLEGKKKTRVFTDAHGQEQKIVEIIVDQDGDMQLVGRKEAQSV